MEKAYDIFQSQNNCLQGKLELDKKLENDNNLTLIKFDFYNKHYAINIKYIHEIIESSEIIPYPEKLDNHVGIINLRGRIIPVINIFEHNSNLILSKNKIIILEFSSEKIFAIITNKIQKFSLNHTPLISGQTINLNGIPTCYLEEKEFNF